MNANKNIKKLNIKLPEAKAPVGNYAAIKILERCCYIRTNFY